MKHVLGQQVEIGTGCGGCRLKQPSAALFIAGKLFRFFIADEPAPPIELLQPLAEQLTADRWQLAGTVRKLLGSQLMFSTQGCRPQNSFAYRLDAELDERVPADNQFEKGQ